MAVTVETAQRYSTSSRPSLPAEYQNHFEEENNTVTLEDEIQVALAMKERTQELAKSRRGQIERFVDGIPVQVFVFCLIIIDIVLAFTIDEDDAIAISICILLIYCIEIGLRMYAYGYERFLNSWIDLIDTLIVLISLILVAAHSLKAAAFTTIVRLSRVIRIVRFFRVGTKLVKAGQKAPKSIRTMVRQNKQGYRDEKWDLDLVYVTDKIIAMSIPGDGVRALFRNSSSDVVNFLDEKHPDHYLIFNLCLEQNYNAEVFHNRVRNYTFEDHSVPTLSKMLKVAHEIQEFFEEDPKNTAVIHCRGGKGRTGTIVSAVLLDRYTLSTPEEVLLHFENMRTDYFGKKKQGLSTPSQERFVKYFYKLRQLPDPTNHILQDLGWTVNSISLGPVNHRKDIVWEINVSMFYEDETKDQNAYVYRNRGIEEIMEDNLLLVSPEDSDDEDWDLVDVTMDTEYDGFGQMNEQNFEDVRLTSSERHCLRGNVRLLITRKTKKKQVKLGIIWLNTVMSRPNAKGQIVIPKSVIDKLHKDKKCKKVPEDFSVTINCTFN